jgi:hypothetical protein
MRGELDDALARLRRWNEVRERLDERAGRTPDPERDSARDSARDTARDTARDESPAAAPYARLTSPPAPPVPLPVIPAPARPSSSNASTPVRPAPSQPLSAPGGAGPPAAGTGMPPAGSPTRSTPAPAPGEPRTPPVVEEVLAAIGEIVLRHRQLAVTVTVDDSGTAWTAHLVFGEDGGLSVTRMEPRTFSTLSSGPRPARSAPSTPTSPAPASTPTSPAPASTPASPAPDDPEASERTASRLAELIRRDPSLLDPPRDLPR